MGQNGQYLLGVGLNDYRWYQSQTPNGVPARKLSLQVGGFSNIRVLKP